MLSKLIRTVAIFGLSALLLACGGTSESTERDLQFTVLHKGDSRGANAFRTEVIRDQSAWATLWASVNSRGPESSPPSIDFSKNMAIGVFLGSRPDGCYSVDIQRIYLSEANKIVVNFIEGLPKPGNFCTQAITYPSVIVTVPQSNHAVEFIGSR